MAGVAAFYGDFLVAEAVPFLAEALAGGAAFFLPAALALALSAPFFAGVAALVADFLPGVAALPFFSATGAGGAGAG